jgi:hypothetical protein
MLGAHINSIGFYSLTMFVGKLCPSFTFSVIEEFCPLYRLKDFKISLSCYWPPGISFLSKEKINKYLKK